MHEAALKAQAKRMNVGSLHSRILTICFRSRS
jgi:hypothetical protein